MLLTPSPSAFTEAFVALNCPELANRFRWSFQAGMLFQDSGCWWKEARRAQQHEGVDFCCYHAGGGRELQKVGLSLVPGLYEGVVLKVIDDFLGQTVWMVHRSIRWERLVLYSALGHIIPDAKISEGRTIGPGETVGRISPEKKGSPLAMHLHLSVFWAPTYLKPERLNWQDLPASRVVRLFDPLSIISKSA